MEPRPLPVLKKTTATASPNTKAEMEPSIEGWKALKTRAEYRTAHPLENRLSNAPSSTPRNKTSSRSGAATAAEPYSTSRALTDVGAIGTAAPIPIASSRTAREPPMSEQPLRIARIASAARARHVDRGAYPNPATGRIGYCHELCRDA